MIFDKDLIQKINLIENLTNAKVKDILVKDKLIIIVEQGEISKAIGKKGKNIKIIERVMHKKVRVIEFDKDPVKFIKNFIYPIKAEITVNNDIKIKVDDRRTKGLLIGRESRNLIELNKLTKDYFNLSVKVL
ncbi:MAG: NusA-like transcription termination signal-binding factor [Nanoarchaeota archaeon]